MLAMIVCFETCIFISIVSLMYETRSSNLRPRCLSVDDGKLFQGSGVGDAFGPRCFEGDIMGCGIMFPRDFNPDGGGEHLLMLFPRFIKAPCLIKCCIHPSIHPCFLFFVWVLSDDVDDWDLDVFPKPCEVQNDLYANNEEEEEEEGGEGEDLEGRKVMVSCYQAWDYKTRDSESLAAFIASLCCRLVFEQVFFTRNGKVVGRREVALPLGGFYPTIGMMSTGEKVRVDLHPLSG